METRPGARGPAARRVESGPSGHALAMVYMYKLRINVTADSRMTQFFASRDTVVDVFQSNMHTLRQERRLLGVQHRRLFARLARTARASVLLAQHCLLSVPPNVSGKSSDSVLNRWLLARFARAAGFSVAHLLPSRCAGA